MGGNICTLYHADLTVTVFSTVVRPSYGAFNINVESFVNPSKLFGGRLCFLAVVALAVLMNHL